jgi:predicted DCC family thiol-disulfide oxidoreductase YuxK
MEELSQLGGRALVIFDGTCGFCDETVRWFLRRDTGDRVRFVAFDSPRIQTLLDRHCLRPPDAAKGPNTMIVVRDPDGSCERVCLASDAVVALLAELPRPWPMASAVLRAIPHRLRDLGYRVVARYRYRIRGRLARCPLPTAEERARFL